MTPNRGIGPREALFVKLLWLLVPLHKKDHKDLSENYLWFVPKSLNRFCTFASNNDWVKVLDFVQMFRWLSIYQHLLLKLDYYGISGNTKKWITSFLDALVREKMTHLSSQVFISPKDRDRLERHFRIHKRQTVLWHSFKKALHKFPHSRWPLLSRAAPAVTGYPLKNSLMGTIWSDVWFHAAADYYGISGNTKKCNFQSNYGVIV